MSLMMGMMVENMVEVDEKMQWSGLVVGEGCHENEIRNSASSTWLARARTLGIEKC